MAPGRRIELTVTQAAQIAGVKPHTVSMWIVRGHIRRTAHGRIDGASLVAYLDGRGQRGRKRPAT